MRKHKIIVLFGLLLIVGCVNREDLRPKRDCPIEQLLLDESDYPSETILDTIHSPIAEEPLESAGRSAYPKDSWTNQMVIRNFSKNLAITKYDKFQKLIFNPDEVIGSWKTPPELIFDSLSADQYEVACGNVISFGKRCYMIGQYEEYFVFFRADVPPSKETTYEMFRGWIVRIDKEMEACLSSGTEK